MVAVKVAARAATPAASRRRRMARSPDQWQAGAGYQLPGRRRAAVRRQPRSRAALPGTALGHLGEPSTASPAARAAQRAISESWRPKWARLQSAVRPLGLRDSHETAGGQLGVTDAETSARLDAGELQVQVWELMNSRHLPVAEAIAESAATTPP